MSQKAAPKRSSIMKMLAEVNENRIIRVFPKPYLMHLTPYAKIDFCERTRDICRRYQCDRGFVLKICKIIVLGDVCVGKTCIVNRFCHQVFDTNYKATIGVDFEVEKFELLNVPFNVQIWDTAGQERFKCIAQAYYRSAHVVVVVFDISNISTLAHCKTWIREAMEASNFQPYIFLVGTKKDLVSKSSYKMVESYAGKVAKNLNAEYWPVSSKTGENIEELFYRITALAFDDCIVKGHESGSSLKIEIGSSDLISIKKNAKASKNDKRCGQFKCN